MWIHRIERFILLFALCRGALRCSTARFETIHILLSTAQKYKRLSRSRCLVYQKIFYHAYQWARQQYIGSTETSSDLCRSRKYHSQRERHRDQTAMDRYLQWEQKWRSGPIGWNHFLGLPMFRHASDRTVFTAVSGSVLVLSIQRSRTERWISSSSFLSPPVTVPYCSELTESCCHLFQVRIVRENSSECNSVSQNIPNCTVTILIRTTRIIARVPSNHKRKRWVIRKHGDNDWKKKDKNKEKIQMICNRYLCLSDIWIGLENRTKNSAVNIRCLF